MSTVAAKELGRSRAKLPRLSRAETDAIAQRMQVWEEDRVWVEEHHSELLARHPEQWVAVRNRQVIASDRDLDALLENVPDSPYTCIEFITGDRTEIIL